MLRDEYNVHVREVSADVRGKLMSFLFTTMSAGNTSPIMSATKRLTIVYIKIYAYTISIRHVRGKWHVRNLSAGLVRHG